MFGQGTVTFNDRLELTAGARVDYEDKSATLETFYDPAIAPGSSVDADKSFSNVSPQVALAYRLQADKTLYATVGRGYKAGGFNSASPAGNEAYGEEQTWHFEGGAKTLWANGRISGKRRCLLHRLDRPAAERPESGRAGAVLHHERRRRRQQGRRSRDQRQGGAWHRRVHRGWATPMRDSHREASRAG